MALEHKNAAGMFPDRQHIESALNQLKQDLRRNNLRLEQ